MANILILGAGSMGTAFSFPCSENNHTVSIIGTHLENDSIEWGFKAIWYGRGSKNYKYHHEKLSEQNLNDDIKPDKSEQILKC